ncbi:hypothetical protein [Staphylococcus hominis]|uniref:hypothetical protein n=1 Tax=Staphylococcus hominis TaxID=1290 RepID=UPI000778A7F6|nr:hypothetical protein [Staphylococcus hominis]OAW29587.1 hypothetical protein A7I03_09905 [Staphylococcus hominis]
MKYKDNKDVEVLDPSDNRYKDDDYFKREQEYRDMSEHHNIIRYHYGCGCPFGCFSSIFISIVLSIILTFLLNWIF